MRHLAVLAFAVFAASQPAASETPIAAMSYEIFETTIPHGDLPECPRSMAQDGRFCRVVLHNESIHVFAFSEDGDQPLQAVMAYPLDQITFGD